MIQFSQHFEKVINKAGMPHLQSDWVSWKCNDCKGEYVSGGKWFGREVQPGGFKRHLLKYHPNKLKKVKVITYKYV